MAMAERNDSRSSRSQLLQQEAVRNLSAHRSNFWAPAEKAPSALPSSARSVARDWSDSDEDDEPPSSRSQIFRAAGVASAVFGAVLLSVLVAALVVNKSAAESNKPSKHMVRVVDPDTVASLASSSSGLVFDPMQAPTPEADDGEIRFQTLQPTDSLTILTIPTPPPTVNAMKAYCNPSQNLSEPVPAARRLNATGKWAKDCLSISSDGHWDPQEFERNWCWVEMKKQAGTDWFEKSRYEKPSNWWYAQTLAHKLDPPRAPDPWDQVLYPLLDHEICDVLDNGATIGWKGDDPYKKKQAVWDKAGQWFVENVEVYVINLNTSTERLDAMNLSLGKIGLNFTRLEGVDMRLDNAMQDAKDAGFVPKEYSFDQAHKKLKEQFVSTDSWQADGFVDSEYGMGTVGCTAAHLNAMKTASKGNKSLALILEDDAKVDDAFVLKVYSLLHDEAPCDWQVINLEMFFPYGKCISPHLARVHPDGNEPAFTCGHGASWSFASVLYRVSEMPLVISELEKVVWDLERPACLVHDIAFASLSDRINYYAVPGQQIPGYVTALHVEHDTSRQVINGRTDLN